LFKKPRKNREDVEKTGETTMQKHFLATAVPESTVDLAGRDRIEDLIEMSINV
jgi:hypothetical protein